MILEGTDLRYNYNYNYNERILNAIIQHFGTVRYSILIVDQCIYNAIVWSVCIQCQDPFKNCFVVVLVQTINCIDIHPNVDYVIAADSGNDIWKVDNPNNSSSVMVEGQSGHVFGKATTEYIYKERLLA